MTLQSCFKFISYTNEAFLLVIANKLCIDFVPTKRLAKIIKMVQLN